MIFEAQNYTLVMWDAVYSMAVGLVTGFVFQLLSVFFHRGRLAVFIRDMAVCVVFAVLIFSYVVSFANYKVLRWYNIAFGLVGRLAFPYAFSSGCSRYITKVILTIKDVFKRIFSTVYGKLLGTVKKKREKSKDFSQKNPPEVLKMEEIVLYN